MATAKCMHMCRQTDQEIWSAVGSCSDLETHSVYAGYQPFPMVQQQDLQPLVPCSSMSSDEGRLSSMDLVKAEQFLKEEEEEEEQEQLIHTR